MTTKRRWPGYLDIPQGESGDWSIIHKTYPAGQKFSTATFRTAFIGGQKSREIVYDEPTRFHFLCEGDAVWMSDWPVEQAQCDDNLRPIREGRVLVGGLGLGLCATILARRRAISQVTVVEKSPDVVKLVAEHLRVPHGKLRIVVADVFEYLLDRPPTRHCYDWIFHDVWTSDSEGTFLETVLPLRRLSVANEWVANDGAVICWNEDVMRGQILMGLQTRLHLVAAPDEQRKAVLKGVREPTVEEMAAPVGDKYWDLYCEFWSWYRDEKPNLSRAMNAARVYSVVFGQQGWTDRWKRIAPTI